MIIERINYQKTFNLGNYQSERIGVDIQLDEGDDAIDALNEAKKLVEQYHKEKNPHLTEFQEPDVPVTKLVAPYSPVENPTTIPPKVKSTEEKMIEQIETVSDAKVLETYKFLAKKYPSIQDAYDKKLKELTA